MLGVDAANCTVSLEVSDPDFSVVAFEEAELVKSVKSIKVSGNKIEGVPDGSDRAVPIKAALRDACFPTNGCVQWVRVRSHSWRYWTLYGYNDWS